MTNLYQTLGVDSDATPIQIRKAYKILAQRNHPDRDGGDNEVFMRVKAAYDVLSDPERRAKYDATGDTTQVLPVEHKATEMLAQGFLGVAASVGWREHKYAAALTQWIQEQGYGVQREIDQKKKHRSLLQGIKLPNFSGDNDVLQGVVDQQVAHANRQIDELEGRLAVCDKALELMEDYTDEDGLLTIESMGGWTSATSTVG